MNSLLETNMRKPAGLLRNSVCVYSLCSLLKSEFNGHKLKRLDVFIIWAVLVKVECVEVG